MDRPPIKPIAALENALEASLLAQVLQEEGVPFQIEQNDSRLRSLLGAAVYDALTAPLGGYRGFARVWGRVEDEQLILDHLQDVRESQVVEEKPYLVNGRMWRIKRS